MSGPPTVRLPRARVGDLIAAGTIGPRSRPLRASLSVLGIALGVAAIVSVLGITRSSEAQLLADIDRLGTNLLTVTNGTSLDGGETELPLSAPAMIARTSGVMHAAPTAELPGVKVYRSDLVPAYASGGLGVRACDPSLLATLSGTLSDGRFLDRTADHYPITVLGYRAAQGLGVSDLRYPVRVWIGRHWFSVVGILRPVELAPEIDRDALVAGPMARRLLGFDLHPSRIYVRTDVGQTAALSGLLGRAADPEHPEQVKVSQPSAALAARIAVSSASTTLLLGLGAVALLVGAIGIANVLVIGVLERRTEIGLRRALGATSPQIAGQFMGEAILLGALGGTAGIVIGFAVTTGVAAANGWRLLIPQSAVAGSLLTAIAIAVIAGLWPAIRASRLSPTDALRTT